MFADIKEEYECTDYYSDCLLNVYESYLEHEAVCAIHFILLNN